MAFSLLSLGLIVGLGAVLWWRLDKLHRTLTVQALTDPLTGAFNRRHLDSSLAAAIARRNRTSEPASILMFDIDHFKTVNDTFGHAAGDEVLKTLVATVARRARTLDVLFRVGGDEFALLLPCTRYGGAFAVAEDVRALVGAMPVLGGHGVSISIGVCDLQSGHSPASWLEDADAALFEAKQAGRNRVAGRTLPTERDPRLSRFTDRRRSRFPQGSRQRIH